MIIAKSQICCGAPLETRSHSFTARKQECVSSWVCGRGRNKLPHRLYRITSPLRRRARLPRTNKRCSLLLASPEYPAASCQQHTLIRREKCARRWPRRLSQAALGASQCCWREPMVSCAQLRILDLGRDLGPRSGRPLLFRGLHKAAPAGIFLAPFSGSLPLIATHKPSPCTSRGSGIRRTSTPATGLRILWVIQRQIEEAKKMGDLRFCRALIRRAGAVSRKAYAWVQTIAARSD